MSSTGHGRSMLCCWPALGVLQPFLGFHTGLHVWGALFSPICLALMVLALNWACAPFLARDVRMMACLLLLL
jgi:hypothetical protein